uniref:Egg protein CP11 n=1 Tax=Schistosoma japonicum TaxID=6182 RepID=C1LGG0_SCHJA|nr:Egg protein CP11 [Schistosoma japonicum]
MRAAMSINLRQMSSLLCWFIPSMMYFNMLFLENIVAQEPYYIGSRSLNFFETGSYQTVDVKRGNGLFVPDIGFQVTVNQFSYRSVLGFKSGTVLMADGFKHGNQVRSIRMADGNTSSSNVFVISRSKGLTVYWKEMHFCQSHPEVLINVIIFIYDNGFIQCLPGVSGTVPEDFTMTIEITEGIYNGSEDGNGSIVQEKVIYNSVLLDFMTSGLITFIPQKRCLEQTTEDECIAESQQNVSCTWCAECGKCSRNASSCNCLKATEDTDSSADNQKMEATTKRHVEEQTKSATVFQPHKNESSNVKYIVVIVLGVVVIVSFIVGMFVWKYHMTNH